MYRYTMTIYLAYVHYTHTLDIHIYLIQEHYEQVTYVHTHLGSERSCRRRERIWDMVKRVFSMLHRQYHSNGNL